MPSAGPIADFATAHGAALTMADLEAHRCDWVEPIAVDFRGARVHEIPPNGQGIAALMALGMLEHLPGDRAGRRRRTDAPRRSRP